MDNQANNPNDNYSNVNPHPAEERETNAPLPTIIPGTQLSIPGTQLSQPDDGRESNDANIPFEPSTPIHSRSGRTTIAATPLVLGTPAAAAAAGRNMTPAGTRTDEEEGEHDVPETPGVGSMHRRVGARMGLADILSEEILGSTSRRSTSRRTLEPRMDDDIWSMP